MLRPRVELGSRTDLVLARYKLAALPIELPEQFKELVRPYGLEPSLTLKRRLLRHQSFGRSNEPGRNRTCVDLFRRQMPHPLGYRPKISGADET